MTGNVPELVVSRSVGALTDRSLEVAAGMLLKAACPLVGVVNLVIAK